jgi:hypothetical protein
MGNLMASTRQRVSIALAAGCVAVTGILVAISSPSEALEFPLDPYPGFGRSPSAAIRDDTVAYWEAFRREQLVELCMQSSGFEYSPAVAYPTHAMVAVASHLGVAPERIGPPTVAANPSEQNRSYKAGLSPERLDQYTQALVAESAADLEQADRTGMVPAGRGEEFASGGCVGKAQSAVPSVWRLRQRLSDSYDAMRRSVSTSSDLRNSFQDCVQGSKLTASNPGELEAIVAEGGSAAKSAQSALDSCIGVWDEAYRRSEIPASKRFIEDHRQELSLLQHQYRGVEARISKDQEFQRYLASEVAFAEAFEGRGRPTRSN